MMEENKIEFLDRIEDQAIQHTYEQAVLVEVENYFINRNDEFQHFNCTERLLYLVQAVDDMLRRTRTELEAMAKETLKAKH